MRVSRVSYIDAQWLKDTLSRESRKYGVEFESANAGMLNAKWHQTPAEGHSSATS
jgi:hypothetical protein